MSTLAIPHPRSSSFHSSTAAPHSTSLRPRSPSPAYSLNRSSAFSSAASTRESLADISDVQNLGGARKGLDGKEGQSITVDKADMSKSNVVLTTPSSRRISENGTSVKAPVPLSSTSSSPYTSSLPLASSSASASASASASRSEHPAYRARIPSGLRRSSSEQAFGQRPRLQRKAVSESQSVRNSIDSSSSSRPDYTSNPGSGSRSGSRERERPRSRTSSSTVIPHNPYVDGTSRSPITSSLAQQPSFAFNPYENPQALAPHSSSSQGPGPVAWSDSPVPMNAFYPYSPVTAMLENQQSFHHPNEWQAQQQYQNSQSNFATWANTWQHMSQQQQQKAIVALQHDQQHQQQQNGFVHTQPPNVNTVGAPASGPGHSRLQGSTSTNSTTSAVSFPSGESTTSSTSSFVQPPPEQHQGAAARSNTPKAFHPYRREGSTSKTTDEAASSSASEAGAGPSVLIPRGPIAFLSDDDDEPLRLPTKPFAKSSKRSESLPGRGPNQEVIPSRDLIRARKESEPSREVSSTTQPATRATVGSAVAVPVASNKNKEDMGKQTKEVMDKEVERQSRVSMGHQRQSSSTSSLGTTIPTTLGQRSFSLSELEPATGVAASPSPPVPVKATEPMPAVTPRSMPSTLETRPTGRSVSDVPKASEKETPVKIGGLKGRLQRALKKEEVKIGLSSPTPPALRQQRSMMSESAAIRDSGSSPIPVAIAASASASSAVPSSNLGNRRPSNASFAPSFHEPVGGNGGKAKRSLFNMRNASTDNISVSSTVSSASMMIRKMGALGKLARRNSVAGISKLFKDKNKDDDDIDFLTEKKDKKQRKKDKKLRFGQKASQAASSTTHATVEANNQDRPIDGLSPAAQLARQHTLRSRAEEQAAKEAAARQLEADRYHEALNEQAYDDDEGSSRFDDTVDDLTYGMAGAGLDDQQYSTDFEETDYEAEYHWGTSYRDRHAVPARGILKAISSFTADNHMPAHNAPWLRARANSTVHSSGAHNAPGPMSKVSQSPDPALFDGTSVNKHDPFSSNFSPFDSTLDREPLADRLNFPYANPSMNTSAPVLSLMGRNDGQHGKPQRSATPLQEKKNLNWAPECAIYHTFHSTEYDRRSEQATCNRLTPQLAQQIKDELNGYKMEEMPVHPSSRVHTHFL